MKKRIFCILGLALSTSMLLGGCSASTTYGKYLKLGDYKGLSVSRIKTEVTDDVLEDEIQYVLNSNAEYEEVDRAASDNDMVNFDYSTTVDGEIYEDGSEESLDVELGQGYLEGYFLEDAEEELIGMKAGDTKEVTLSVSEDYYDDTLAGKDVVVELTVNTVSEVNRPELTDEFVQTISDFSTAEEYKENLKEAITASMDETNDYYAGSDALSLVIENSTFSGYPEELYTECKELYDASNQAYADMQGLDVEDFALDEDAEKETIETMVYEEMVITTIAEKENLSVSDEEYESYLEQLAEEYGYDSAEDFEAEYSKESIVNEMLRDKVQAFLLENADITEVSEEEYYGDYEDDIIEEEDLFGDDSFGTILIDDAESLEAPLETE